MENQRFNKAPFITDEEVSKMATVPMLIERSVFINKTNNSKRKSYVGNLEFDKDLTLLPIRLTSDEFALLHFYSGRKAISDQFRVTAKVRIIRTDWPEHNGMKANSTYRIDVYISKELSWSVELGRNKFIHVLLKGVENGTLKQFTPLVSIPTLKDMKEVEKEVKENLEDNTVPF